MRKVVHLTSAHPRTDTRIFLKMCRSLARSGYDVSLVVADGLGDETKEGVHIVDVGRTRGGRLSRWTGTVVRVLRQALRMEGDIYHLHDPELLLIALRLKWGGKTVIFDAHEDVPKQVLSKTYMSPLVRRVVSFAFSILERLVCRRLDAVIGATPSIQRKFEAINLRSVNVNNYPILGELALVDRAGSDAKQVVFVGAMHTIRGIKELVQAMDRLPDISLALVGTFNDDQLETDVRALPGWGQVRELGFLGRAEVAGELARSLAGLVTFYPLPNHVDAQPNKMFEYMSAGLPVICSNFPLWREIIEENECGLCVDPLDPVAISQAIREVADNPEAARRMGANGQRAVTEKYSWSAEEATLTKLYGSVS